MRLNIECANLEQQEPSSITVLEVDYTMSIEDVIALLTVSNTNLDFDTVVLVHNGQKLQRTKKLSDYGIQDDYTLLADLK